MTRKLSISFQKIKEYNNNNIKKDTRILLYIEVPVKPFNNASSNLLVKVYIRYNIIKLQVYTTGKTQ